MPFDTTRLLEIADRFDQLAAKERDKKSREGYGRLATQLRELASDRILERKE